LDGIGTGSACSLPMGILRTAFFFEKQLPYLKNTFLFWNMASFFEKLLPYRQTRTEKGDWRLVNGEW